MSTLTAMKLNEQIVSMRKPVEKARVRLSRRLIRQMKLFQKSKIEKKIRKKDRLVEEINSCKRIRRDDISKFALVNCKPLRKLLEKIKLSVDERILYKLACEKPVVSSVEEFRMKYPNWQYEVPFMLQRLGLQYRAQREAKKIKKQLKQANKVIEPENSQEIKSIVRNEIQKAAKNKRSLKKNMNKLKKENKSTLTSSNEVEPVITLPQLALPASLITKGETVIKVLRLDGNEEEQPSSIITKYGNEVQEERSTVQVDDNISLLKSERIQESDFFVCQLSEKQSDVSKQTSSTKSKELVENVELTSEYQKLHPSWIAKKLEREAREKLIKLSKPKKIIFTDE
ncbi:unnamed protein product [Thelazia callipaeda]|uniref:Serum response factor-binding protein 1 n=1 Tax=Thelazia callipaeda TaxID=103827 RepID=A0A158RAN8_THECL|nr:unnamed protein product [Thelazia callipaeda]